MSNINEEQCPYSAMAKIIVEDALSDGHEFRYFNNLFIEIANEMIGKEFDFNETVFNSEDEVFKFFTAILTRKEESVSIC